MNNFRLFGKIISEDNNPVQGYNVTAYDDDFFSDDDFLGCSYTDSGGFFEITFDESKFRKYYELFESSPDVYLFIRDAQGKLVVNTKILKTEKEIEYHVKIVKHIPDPTSVDLYSGNARRLLSLLTDIRETLDLDNQINLDILSNGNLLGESKEELQNFINGHEERIDNLNHLLVIFHSMVNSSLNQLNIQIIDYGGPQVPRLPRRQKYDQTIMWSRRENFKWE